MIENEMLPEFIDNLLEQVNDDRLWQLYLAVAITVEKPFSAWKAEVLQGTVPEREDGNRTGSRELTPEQAVSQAESILAGFNPF